MKASVSVSSDMYAGIMSGDEKLVNDTQSNVDDDHLSDFCELDSKSSRNIKFPTVARECDRYGVSDAARTAALSDYGIIKKHDREAIIDRAKLRYIIIRSKISYVFSTPKINFL